MAARIDPHNLFTPEEEQRYQEIAEKSCYHFNERVKLEAHLKYYRDWKCLMNETGRPDLHQFTPEEEAMYREMAEQATYHFRENEKCQMALKPYRDLKNVIAYACEEGFEKGERRAALRAAKECLKLNLPVNTITRITGLSEEEVEALRQTPG